MTNRRTPAMREEKPVRAFTLECEEKTCKSTSENDKTVSIRHFRLAPSGDVESAVLCDTHTKAWLG